MSVSQSTHMKFPIPREVALRKLAVDHDSPPRSYNISPQQREAFQSLKGEAEERTKFV
jgi:hypothetical protein